MSQSGPPPVAASPPDQLQLPAEEKRPSRGWTHQELLPLIQDDSRHDELNQLLDRLTSEERAKLFEHRFEHELVFDEEVSDAPAWIPESSESNEFILSGRTCDQTKLTVPSRYIMLAAYLGHHSILRVLLQHGCRASTDKVSVCYMHMLQLVSSASVCHS